MVQEVQWQLRHPKDGERTNNDAFVYLLQKEVRKCFFFSSFLQDALGGVFLSNDVFIASELGAILKKNGSKNSNNRNNKTTFIRGLWEPNMAILP